MIINIRQSAALSLPAAVLNLHMICSSSFFRMAHVWQGTTYNTGDGIRMAQQAGADLWHMNNALAGVGAILVDDETLGKVPVTVSMFGTPYILIDSQGKRFMNESVQGRHGLGEKEHLSF
jgi:succinate dehydrogenase/fumarate reductase flavoprotein subunit